ncbi:hypothetical protein QE152_g39161 [Popillia japonica]|uniref:Uncharacterized protein n=1 Tax=Popillia japonica TaxID=7064 RepID=A0AAW1HVE2_POPJA
MTDAERKARLFHKCVSTGEIYTFDARQLGTMAKKGRQGNSIDQDLGKEISKEILQKKEMVAVNVVDCAAIQGKDVRQRNQPVEPVRKQDIEVRFFARRRRR